MLEEETTELAQDAYDVVASWLAHKAAPEGWKGKMSPMYETLCFCHLLRLMVLQRPNGMRRNTKAREEGMFQTLVPGSEVYVATEIPLRHPQRTRIRRSS